MPVLKIKESIIKERAEFLLSLNENERIKLLWRLDDEKTNKGEKWDDKNIYIACVVRYLKTMLENDCTMDIEYKFSDKMRTNGRQFASFGLQSCKKNLRGFLCSELYHDYDMENCHIKILRHILMTYVFKGDKKQFKHRFPYIMAYAYNTNTRKMFLEKAECSKQAVLNMLNNPNNYEVDNDVAQKIDTEFKEVQNIFWDKCPTELLDKYCNFKDPNVKNKKGTWLNRLLTIFENEIIMKVYKYYKNKFDETPLASLVFDGVHIDKNIGDQVSVLNDISEEYGCTWAIKDFDTSIEKSEVWEERSVLPPYESFQYEYIKEQFEKSHAMVIAPPIFIKEKYINKKLQVALFSQTDFKGVVKPVKYEKLTSRGIEKVSIFEKWHGDINRREYWKLDFIPDVNFDDPHVYNTFQGFDYYDYETAHYTPSDILIKAFRKHISIITNYHNESVEWCMKYFADIFQNPCRLPKVAIVFKSRQGMGKDTCIDALEKLLGKSYLHRTAKPDDIFGGFNACAANKMIMQLNEMGGKAGFANKDDLKNYITEGRTKINDKNMKHYYQSNTLRVIICSNNTTPIEVPMDDRRFVVFQGSLDKPDSSYFNTFHGLLQDDNELYSLYKYFMDYDLGDEALKDCRPITDAYDDMKKNAVHPFYYWLFESLQNYEHEFEGEYKTHKKTGEVLVKSEVLFNNYKDHMATTNQEMRNFTQHRTMKDMLSRFHITGRRMLTDGSKVLYYSLNVKYLITHMKGMGLEEECLDLNNDDYE